MHLIPVVSLEGDLLLLVKRVRYAGPCLCEAVRYEC